MDRGAWWATVYGVARVGPDLVTKQQLHTYSVVSLCLTSLCVPTDCSPPGSSVHGILQARILGWGAIPFSGDLPDPGIESKSPALQEDSLTSKPPEKPPHTRLKYFKG